MGEEGASREIIACNNLVDSIFSIDNHQHIAAKIACLHSSIGDKFTCVHNAAFGYFDFTFIYTHEEALMIRNKGINGEMSIVT